jgi:hypothetical protein
MDVLYSFCTLECKWGDITTSCQLIFGSYKKQSIHGFSVLVGWQHVLEHGRDHERKEIITKLAGQIVQMSQHKFASNVVEKCLEFGGPAERQILINEMLGHTDENEPLQVGHALDL